MNVHILTKSNRSGIVSSLTWKNPDVERYMRLLFGCGKDETITDLEITHTGITACFGNKAESTEPR